MNSNLPNQSSNQGPQGPSRPPQGREQGGAPRRNPARREGGGGGSRPGGWRGGMRSAHPRRPGRARVEHHPGSARTPSPLIPEPSAESVRIIPLGGVEEIGRNMTAVEFGGDIFILDCGFQFREEETPGIDYILPNTGYLEERRDRIRGLIISHGHLDHIGGIPYIMDRIGNPIIYTRRLTGMMIRKRQEAFTHMPPVNIREIEMDETIKLGSARVRFFGVTHTVPDSMGIIIETPWGDVVFTGDIKLSHQDGEPSEEEHQEYSIFQKRNVLALLMDSTNVWQPGFSIPESTVYRTLENIIRDSKGRLVVD